MRTRPRIDPRPLFVLVALFVALPGVADTLVSGNISTSTTWTTALSPYVVTGTISVESTGTTPVLTIQPGVTVKFNSGTWLQVGTSASTTGELQAVGTSGSPIVFTANTGSPTAGYWVGIQLNQFTTATSRITYATISYGGQTNNDGGILVSGCSPTLDHITAQNNADSGIRVNGGSPVITNSTLTANPWGLVLKGTGSPSVTGTTVSSNTTGGISITYPSVVSLQTMTITNNTGYAISQDARATLGTVSGLTATGNTTNGIELNPLASIAANATWKNVGLPYVVTNVVAVEKVGTPTPVLTIEAGNTIKFASGTWLQVGTSASTTGELQAVGTSGSPIVFTANTGSPTAGYWAGIRLNQFTTATSRITYATISYGGQTNVSGGILVYGCSPTLDHITAQNNADSGIRVNGGSPTITNSTITASPWGLMLTGTGSPSLSGTTTSNNTTGGVYVGFPSSPSLTTATITNNTGYAISQDCRTVLGTVSGLTVTGNTNNAIELRSGTIDTTMTWPNYGVPYAVTDVVTVQKNGTPRPVLTVAAGVTVKFNSGVYIQIGYNYPGEFHAVGTAASPIVFTANTASPTAGYWRGIYFDPNAASTSQIAYATVSYGGGAGWGAVHAGSTSPTLDHVTFSNNSYAGVSANLGAPTIVNCSFTGNTAGVVNQTTTIPLNASLNWWNATSGPSGSGPGTGQSITAGVLFDPWITAAGSSPEYVSSAGYSNRKFNPSATSASWNLASSQSASWTMTITNSQSTVVRTLTASGLTAALSWDGKNGSGVLQPDGTYTYSIAAVAGTTATPGAGRVFIDSTFLVAITAPASGGTLSDVYQTGSTSFAFTGTARMSNLTSWNLEYGAGASPTVWTAISSGASSISASTLGTWSTTHVAWGLVPDVANGLYTIRLRATDNETNGLAVTQTETVGNFLTVQQQIRDMNSGTGATISYTSTLPFTLTETLVVKNLAGQVVRTLFNASRLAGTFVDVWNGRNDSGNLVPDGPYFWVATAVAGASSMTLDLSTSYWNGTLGSVEDQTLAASDPFNNLPMTFSWTFGTPGIYWVRLRPAIATAPIGDCTPPRYCAVNAKYTEAGPKTFNWAWIDNTSAFRGDVTNIDVQQSTYVAQNVVVTYGTKPSVSSVRVTPPFYGPTNGTQTVSCNLTSYQNQTVTLVVTLTNLSSNSILRTITVNNQAPGSPVNVTWDGHADNGMWVAPGFYAATVTVTDTIGNVVSGQILTTVAF